MDVDLSYEPIVAYKYIRVNRYFKSFCCELLYNVVKFSCKYYCIVVVVVVYLRYSKERLVDHMYKIIDINGNTLQDHFATKGEAQTFAKYLKQKTKVTSDTKEQLARSIEKRQELPADKGKILDEQQASASYILCNTLALNLVHELLKSKAQVISSCLSAGFAVKCKGPVMDLQDAVYNALQSAGIDCYCNDTSVMIDWVAIDIRPNFVSVQCTLDEYTRCMRWLEVHERL